MLVALKYPEAKALALGFKATSDKYNKEKKALVDRIDALARFKTQLVRDLAASPCGVDFPGLGRGIHRRYQLEWGASTLL